MYASIARRALVILLATCTLALADALVAGLAVPAAAAAPAAPSAGGSPAQAVAQAIASGDAVFNAFDYERAYGIYTKGIARDSSSAELWWRVARCLTDRGLKATYDGRKDAATAPYQQALYAARKATALAPDSAAGHLELSIALGNMALAVGGKEKIRLSKDVRAEAERTILLDRNAHRAYHVLGRWNRGIAELSFFEKTAAKVVYGGVPEGATMNNAVTYFEKAIEIAPDFANHHLELGRTYLKIGLKDKARAEFERAMSCPPQTPFDAHYKDEASRLLAQAK
jgi:tetratricopeptide (TPR) repeat protein